MEEWCGSKNWKPLATPRSSIGFFLSILFAALGFSHTSEAADVNLRIVATQPGVSGPVAVRTIIRKSDGSYVPGEWDNFSFPVTMRGKAVGPNTIITVPQGQTEIIVGKGVDYLPQTIVRNFDVPGQTYTVNVTLQPVFDLYRKGWRGGDGHVHFNHGENQISRSPDEAFTMLAAGGMNFASLAEEHFGAVAMTRQQMFDAFKKFDGSECELWLGVEEPKNAWGHHVAIVEDPWSIRSALPYHWGIKSVHDQGGVSYPVHPQRIFPAQFFDNPNSGQREWVLYPHNNYLKSYPLDALLGYLDGWSGLSDRGHSLSMLEPYFKLLSLGYRIPFLADSDVTMDRLDNGIKSPGCWMTYYQVGNGPLTQTSIANAMRQGRVMSTTGPLVFFTIDGAESGDTLVPNGSARTVRIQASHTFSPWTLSDNTFNGSDRCKISQIDLFRNGEVVRTWNPNEPTTDIEYTINESSPGSHYMVRVLGNENQWMAAYASPIYFDNTPRPRQPEVFKSLINGRLYDANTGEARSGSVSCVRYGQTEWTIQTDSQGLFRAYVPLDAELVARDSAGREFRQDILKHEPAYAFCHYLSDNFVGRMGESVDAFKQIVSEMNWEFPLGHQPAASYVKTNLAGNGVMNNFVIDSAPTPASGKRTTEIVMLIVDKTQVSKGDTINFAVIYRQPQGQTPSEELSVEWKGWDPNHPRMYTRYGTIFQHNNSAVGLTSLGNGFYVRQGSVVVPNWVANATETTAAIKLFASVRGASGSEEAILLLPLGPTKRELLVSTTWDGLPGSWGENGIGPCNFHRELSPAVRYADYRTMSVSLNVNGRPMTIRPAADTAHVPDADNAAFYENFYYDYQCEPHNRNVAFRDPIRGQPAEPDFSSVTIQSPGGGGGGGGGGGNGDQTAPIIVEISGAGTTSPALDGKELVVGREYQITARPRPGQVFSNWSGSISSSEATLAFTMQPDLILRANFVPNPFAPAKGVYSGLLYETDASRHESAGFFTLNMTAKGSFSARFIVGGKNASARGKFVADGTAPLRIRSGKINLTGSLLLEDNQLSGDLTDGNWTAQIFGNKARGAGPASQYTILFPAPGTEGSPIGDGFGSVNIQRSGKVRFAGALADGSKVTHSVPISPDGKWPFYAKLYRGQGAIFGWVNLGTNINGTVNWDRPKLTREKLYPAGFTNVLTVSGSPYNPRANPLLDIQNGVLSFTGGNLESLESPVQLGSRNRFQFGNGDTNKTSIKLKMSSGIFDGRFRHPQTRKPTRFQGAILQNQNSGSGFFLGTDQSGRVHLQRTE